MISADNSVVYNIFSCVDILLSRLFKDYRLYQTQICNIWVFDWIVF